MADNVKTSVKGGIDEAASGAKNLADRGINAINREIGGSPKDAARDALHTVVEKAGDYAHQAREKVGEYAHDARAKVGEWAEQAGDKVQKYAGEAYEVATDKAGDFGREVTDLVRRHPLPALLIGFGVGLLVGRAARMV